MSKTKTAKRKAPKADVEPVSPPDQWEPTVYLRFIDGELHQKYVPHANLGISGEHWQPVEAWETDSEGEQTQVAA
jgi:hypothetical protein